ncbi:MAG TPA: NADH-quinone oxidoreductase subunit J [Planctomycetota bacterium]|nr:NADH-quinone oxidoreductase subunit J [Planctomycetota bacterium]
MNWSDLAFLFCALLAIISAMVLINQRQPVYAALAMLAMFLGITGIFTLLNASFVAAMQIMVYGGAVIVVFLFVIMLLNYQPEELPVEREGGFKLVVALACALVALSLGLIVGLGSAREVAAQPTSSKIIQKITRLKPAGNTEAAPVGAGFLPMPTATLQTQIDNKALEFEKVTKAKAAAEAAAAAAAGKTGAEVTQAKAGVMQATQAFSAVAADQARLESQEKAELEFGSAKGLGKALFNLYDDDQHSRYSTSYLVPFELLSLLIVGAMMGAVILSKPRVMQEPVVDSSHHDHEVHAGAGHKD